MDQPKRSRLGHLEREVEETDLRTFSWAIVLGSLLGALTLEIGGIAVGLGSAGGLLALGLLVGYLRSLFPVFGSVPSGARWILTELGLLLFMASVGLRGGAGLIETLLSSGPALVLVGVIVTGNEDGAHDCCATTLYNFTHYGCTVPPNADCYWVGDAGPGDDERRRPERDQRPVTKHHRRYRLHWRLCVRERTSHRGGCCDRVAVTEGSEWLNVPSARAFVEALENLTTCPT